MGARFRRFIASGWALLIELAALQLAPLLAIWALAIPFLVSSDCGRDTPGCSPSTTARIHLLYGLAIGCLVIASTIIVARAVVGGRSRSSAAAGAVGSLVGWVCLVLVPAPDMLSSVLVALVLGALAGGSVLRGASPKPSRH